jgi:tryptophanyl-tRNA synthetase
LTDDPDKAAKKIMKAETDSGKEIKFNPEKKPGISNLLTIYALFAQKTPKDLEKEYQGKGYGDLKKDLVQVVKDFLTDFQKKYNKISDAEVRKIMDKGSDTIRPIAEETIRKAKEKIGIN